MVPLCPTLLPKYVTGGGGDIKESIYFFVCVLVKRNFLLYKYKMPLLEKKENLVSV